MVKGIDLLFQSTLAAPAKLATIRAVIVIEKHWRRILATVVLLGLGCFVTAAYWSGSEIASPSRRPLMDYHRDFLSNPAAHGIHIETFIASDGTPCLIVTPEPSGRLGDRGTIIRQQLDEHGRSLPPPGEIIGTLVLTHGRKGRKEDYLPIAERLCAVGFRCLMPDLPAHGDHPAAMATYGIREKGLPHLVLREAAEHHAFHPAPAGLIGMSMGASVAVHAAAREDAPWRALVVISSFDSLKNVVYGQASRRVGNMIAAPFCTTSFWVYEWKTGIRLDEIQPREHAASIRMPTLVAHGTADHVIAASAGRNLFEALPKDVPNQWVEVPGADHDNVLITDFPIYAEIAEWMLRHLPE